MARKGVVPRPVCGCCGKPYGSRGVVSETVTWPAGEAPPAYRGNGVLIKDVGEGRSVANRATARAVTMMSVNPDIRAQQEARLMQVPEESLMTGQRETWDGETWRGGYDPFCTLRCALSYARKAWKNRKPTP